MDEKRLNERESLELITRMMQNTQRNFQRGDGNVLIIWGCATLIANIVVFALLHFTKSPLSYWAWMLTPAIGILWTKIRGNREPKVITQIDRMVSLLFVCITYISILVPLAFLGINMVAKEQLIISGGTLMAIIPFIEMLIVSLGLTATSIMIGFRAQTFGGIMGIFLSLFLLSNSPCIHTIIFGIWAIASMIIPGICLNRDCKTFQDA